MRQRDDARDTRTPLPAADLPRDMNLRATPDPRAEERGELRLRVGARIREWRKRRGQSQARLAGQSGITQAALSNYERGRRDLPLSTFLRLAGALDVALGDLVEIEDAIVVRESRLGRAVEALVAHPSLLEVIETLSKPAQPHTTRSA